jgi:predicted  nucleic acid-binding Zn-ribbon protein
LNQRNECLEKELLHLKATEEIAGNALDDSRNQVAFQRSLSGAMNKSFEQSLMKVQQAVADVKSECQRNQDDIGKLPINFEVIGPYTISML